MFPFHRDSVRSNMSCFECSDVKPRGHTGGFQNDRTAIEGSLLTRNGGGLLYSEHSATNTDVGVIGDF